MANRYIRHGATFCGDGTTSALATVNGGPGAWNDIAVFESTIAPAYGTLPAGTDVYVLTKDEAGNDITISYAASKTLGTTAATLASQVNWIFDNGAVWPGVDGVVTFATTTNVGFAIRNYNNLFAATDGALQFITTSAYWAGQTFMDLGQITTKGVKLDTSATTSASGPCVFAKTGAHTNLYIKRSTSNNGTIQIAGIDALVTFVNLTLELTVLSTSHPIFGLPTSGTKVVLYGGEIFGDGANGNGLVLVGWPGSNGKGVLHAHGFKYPKAIKLATSAALRIPGGDATMCSATGADGAIGAEYADSVCYYTSRADLSPPKLNATLETSAADLWSWQMYPYRASASYPAKVSTSKLYTQAAAVKTVTQEILWPETLAAPSTKDVWITVQYTDSATGVRKYVSTQAYPGDTLAPSSAAWTATTWGSVILSKYKIAVTTATAIAQDSEVIVTLFVAVSSATSDDILFVCPDPVLS